MHNVRYPQLQCHIEWFSCPKNPELDLFISPSPDSWQPLIFLLSSVLPFPECHVLGIFSLINMVLRWLHVFLWLDSCTFFFFLPVHCMYMASQVAQLIKNLPASARGARHVDSVSGLGRSPGRGNGNLFQYPCLENSKDRGAWLATVHGVAKELTDWLSTHPGRIRAKSVWK